MSEMNNLPPLEDEEQEDLNRGYVDRVVNSLYIDLDVNFGLSGTDDTITVNTDIRRGEVI